METTNPEMTPSTTMIPTLIKGRDGSNHQCGCGCHTGIKRTSTIWICSSCSKDVHIEPLRGCAGRTEAASRGGRRSALINPRGIDGMFKRRT